VSDIESGFGELIVHDADGSALRAYDDVVLLDDAPVLSIGVHPDPAPTTVKKGTRATLLMLLDAESGTWDLECYPSDDSFVFAQQPSSLLRLVQRAKDKTADWKRAVRQ
jgi:hypothetical protein